MFTMPSWKLFRYLIDPWDVIDNPMFMREINRTPPWKHWVDRIPWSGCALQAISVLTCYMTVIGMFQLNNVLFVLVPLWLVWLSLLSQTLSPVVVQERERRTWETLRTVPLSTEMIVLGKVSGALWGLRDIMRALMVIFLVFAVIFGFMSIILTPLSMGGSRHAPVTVLCLSVLLMPLAGGIAFLLDRAQHFVLTVVAMLAASMVMRSVRSALSAALVASLIVWLVDVALAALLLALQPGRPTLLPEVNWLALVTLGPMAGYVPNLTLWSAVLYLGSTLLVREIAVRSLWRWTMHRATRL